MALQWLAGRRLLRIWLAALLVGLAAWIGFSDAVPGPVLGGSWRWVAAGTFAAVVGAWLHWRVHREGQR
ncbi:MAG: hypothetical protein M3N32_04090 [Actinomycetota bacterium]|nr:hypothetical protein [Actinomycetota bacterium]